MTRPRIHLRAIAFVALAAVMIVPAYAEDADTSAPGKPNDGLTRDAFTDPGTPPRPTAPPTSPAPAPSAPRASRARSRRTRLDSKDFLSVHHARHHRTHAKARTQVAAVTPPMKRRNPVVNFVYWWNGFVIKNFHTKIGTVMLGTVGAKS